MKKPIRSLYATLGERAVMSPCRYVVSPTVAVLA